MSLNLATMLRESAQLFPDKPAVIRGARSLCYAELDDQCRRFAGVLQGLGVRRGEHVAVMIPNVPEFTIAYFGCHYAANPLVPLNILLKSEEIAYHLRDSNSVALVVWEEYLEEAAAAARQIDECRHLVVVREHDAPAAGIGDREDTDFATALRGTRRVEEIPDTCADDTAVILYTSGTTGQPKGAELTHFNLFYNAETKFTRLDADTVSLVALPLFHSFGQTVVQNGTILAGGTMVMMARFDPEDALALMREHQVTYFAGVPTMYFGLLHSPDAASFDAGKLTYCVSGGAPMPVEVMTEFEKLFSVQVYEGYGLSETSPVASFNVPGRPRKPGSIGLPIWGVQFKLLADDGTRIDQPGVPGEICIKGHNIMKGYYRRPEATAEAVQDGWLRTGDVATVDQEGYYFIVDRKKDMIIRGGFNVYPREIEEVLYGHPAVAEAAVIGVPDERHGEEVKAFIACKAGERVSGQEIVEYCKSRMAAYKYPRSVVVLDQLPKGPTGKILKRALR